MQKKIFPFIAVLIFAFAISAAAHPLGNFSINQYSRIEVEKSNIKLRAVLDMAEIPTFQESQAIDTDKDGSLSETELGAYAEKVTPNYISNLLLSVDGSLIELRPIAKNISLPPGSGRRVRATSGGVAANSSSSTLIAPRAWMMVRQPPTN